MKFPAKPLFVLFLLILTIMSACKKSEQGSKIPNITFLSLLPNTVKAGSSKDTIWVSLKLVDGDGDVVSQSKVFLIDSRDSSILDYAFPEIDPPTLVDPRKGFDGFFSVGVLAAFLNIEDSTKTADTLQYEMYFVDDSGNESNRIITPSIHLTK